MISVKQVAKDLFQREKRKKHVTHKVVGQQGRLKAGKGRGNACDLQ